METKITLQNDDGRQWALMKALEQIGVFDIRFGRVTINFDGDGKVSNVEVVKNYRLQEFTIPSAGLSTP